MNDFNDWEHDFKFPEGDERAQNEKLIQLQTSCVACYVREKRLNRMEELEERIETIDRNLNAVKVGAIMVFARVTKKLMENPMASVIPLSTAMAVSFSGCVRKWPVVSQIGFFGSFFLILLLAFFVMFLFELKKSLPEIKEYELEFQARKESYERDRMEYAVYATEVEMHEERLKELEEKGGVPEDYWDFGGEIWELIYTGQADTRSDALRQIDRMIHQVEMEKTIANIDG